MTSPWEVELGPRLAELDPALAAYFGAIPPGSVGRGSGVFTTVGTPRRWLWPVLAVLGRAGIVFPVWEHDVPFDVLNEPRDRGVAATRTFRFAGGPRVMRDQIRSTSHGLVDVLGHRGRLEAPLLPEVAGGRLTLRSTGARLRLGRLRIPIPFAPRVTLTESRDDGGARQRVELTMDAPLVGRIYEYAGTFDYRIEPA